MPEPLQVLRGTLDTLILQVLSHGPLHGYGIADWVREATDGVLDLEDGALYTALHRMEGGGWLRSDWGVSDLGRRAKFYALTDEDRARKRVIEKLMCELQLPAEFLKADPTGFGPTLLVEAAQLAQKDEDGFFRPDSEGYHVTEKGRPFVRVLAAHFDAYLNAGKARHSVAV